MAQTSPAGNITDAIFSSAFLRDFHARVDSIAAGDLGRVTVLAEKVFADLPECFAAFQPGFLRDIAANGRDLNPQFKNIPTKTLFTIQALQLVDAAWYRSASVYETDAAIMDDKRLVRFSGPGKTTTPRFSFIRLRESALRRIPNALSRRFRILRNHPAKNTMGLKCPYAPAEMIALLNSLCIAVGNALDRGKPYPIQVNDIVRSREHQEHLKTLGYPASVASSHCHGFAADIEGRWYRENRPEAHAVISEILIRAMRAGIINLIDYLSHWHICLNPLSREMCLRENSKELLAFLEP